MTVPSTAPLTLRQRRRLSDMKRVQTAAVGLFAAEGFDSVSVESIAAAADVSPVSIYRWFGTKEGLVLWDEYDPAIEQAIGDRLAAQAPLEAVRDGLLAELDDVYAADRELVLARAQLIHAEPALMTAARSNTRFMELGLRELFAAHSVPPFDAAVIAAAAVGALAAAVEAWQADDGRRPLADLLRSAFAVLGATA